MQGRNIQHGKNCGEETFGPYRVDGYYETDNGQNVVMGFHGDIWRGNPTIFSRSMVDPVNQMTMGELFDKTLEKQMYLVDQG